MRHRRLLSLPPLLLVPWLASCACAPGSASFLPVAMHAQETGMWCWAGSGQMVMDFLGNNVSQCTQANNRFGRTDCPCVQCGSGAQANPPCVTGGWPEFDKYGFTFQRTNDAPLSEGVLRSELAQGSGCGRRPVAFSWHWSGGGGHMMVLSSYQTIDGELYVTVMDPWAPCTGSMRIVPYSAYVSGAGYTHWDDFYQIRRTS